MVKPKKVFCIGNKEIIEIKPIAALDAKAEAPPSKAHTLRALFLAALAEGKSRIIRPLLAEDQQYAINALREFGVKIDAKDGEITVEGTAGKLLPPSKEIFIGNSGVTARFLAAFASLAPRGKIVINGGKRMQEGRPIQDLIEAMKPLGILAESVNGNGCLPIAIEGGSFQGGKTELKGSISSQYFSSILISAPYAKSDVEIRTQGELRSKPYIDITLQLMKEFGIAAENRNYEGFSVKSGRHYKAIDYKVEGDYSNAAYFFAAAAVTGGKVEVSNLNPDSLQGDKFFLNCLKKMGCGVQRKGSSVTVQGSALQGIDADMSDFPDIVLPLAIVAAFAEGKTTITNIEHLHYKESDRLKATAAELRKIGAGVETTEGSLIIEGDPSALHPATIETYNDHRIAMSFAVVGLRLKGVKISNPDCVKKSFPDFFSRLQALGG